MKTKKKVINVSKDDNIYTFDDTNWQNPNKSPQEMKELSYRGKLLSARQRMPLDLKVRYAQNRIRKVISDYGIDNCVVGFSGGKDSTVVSHIALQMGYKIDHYFSNTRLEYPECVKYVDDWCKKHKVNLIKVLPDTMPLDVWKKYGYPMFTKEIAETLERLRLGMKIDELRLKRAEKFLKYKNVHLSAKCCDYLKKKPTRNYFKKSGKQVIILGTTAEESRVRRLNWIRKGCIYESHKQIVCNPIIFFTEKDVYDYIKKHRIKLVNIYAKGMRRTGCYCCGFGCHFRDENNFMILKRLYPHLYKNVMKKWGFRKICKACDVKLPD